MTQINIEQKTFSGGEISPDLESRSDLDKYQTSLSDSQNVLCTNKGDLIPRPGTEYVDMTAGVNSVGAPEKARLIPFKFSEEESYLIEFTERKMRVFRHGESVKYEYTESGLSDTVHKSISSSIFIDETQYPVASNDNTSSPTRSYASASGEFIFQGKNSFPYDAGAGPFTISGLDGTSAISSFTMSKQTGTDDIAYAAPDAITATSVFWIHSVDRDISASPTINKDSDGASLSFYKPVDVVRITWNPKFCVGGSGYAAAPNNYFVAKAATADPTRAATSRPANNTATKWSFFSAGTTDTTGSVLQDLVSSPKTIFRTDFIGQTDPSSNGTATSPIPYLESELNDLQYAIAGDFIFITHPNYQPRKITRLGLNNFKICRHYTNYGPWRNGPTYPGVAWGGGHYMTGTGSSTPSTGGVDGDNLGYTGKSNIKLYNLSITGTNGYLWKSSGSPDIVTAASGTNADPSIIGRKLRIACPVGKPLFSTQGQGSVRHNPFDSTGDFLDYIDGTKPRSQNTSTSISPNGDTSSISGVSVSSLADFESVSSPAFFFLEGSVEPYIKTSTSTPHSNPLRAYRYRITKPLNMYRHREFPYFVGLTGTTKIGHLFEEAQPDGTGGWPSCVAIFDNRLVYSTNDESPNSIAFSVKGDFNNFEPDDWGANVANTIKGDNLSNWSVASTYNPVTFDYHGFVYSIEEGLADKILWLKSTNYGLIAGTPNGIYLSQKLRSGGAVTPSNFSMRMISEEGSSKVPAEYIDGKIYYISKLGDKLLSMQYSQDADGFRPQVESIFSEHLLKDGVKAMAYARTPISILWLITNTGKLISAVNLDVSKEKALFKHKLGSPDYNNRTTPLINSVAVIPSDELGFDQLYMSVTRSPSLPLMVNDAISEGQSASVNLAALTSDTTTGFNPGYSTSHAEAAGIVQYPWFLNGDGSGGDTSANSSNTIWATLTKTTEGVRLERTGNVDFADGTDDSDTTSNGVGSLATPNDTPEHLFYHTVGLGGAANFQPPDPSTGEDDIWQTAEIPEQAASVFAQSKTGVFDDPSNGFANGDLSLNLSGGSPLVTSNRYITLLCTIHSTKADMSAADIPNYLNMYYYGLGPSGGVLAAGSGTNFLPSHINGVETGTDRDVNFDQISVVANRSATSGLFNSGAENMASERDKPIYITWDIYNDYRMFNGLGSTSNNNFHPLGFYFGFSDAPSINKTSGQMTGTALSGNQYSVTLHGMILGNIVPNIDNNTVSTPALRAAASTPVSPSLFGTFQTPAQLLEGGMNTIERLTNYSPYLKNTQQFVGADCSISNKTIYASGEPSEKITNVLVVDYDTTNDKTRIYVDNESMVIGDKFIIESLEGDLEYLNYGDTHVVDGVDSTNNFYTINTRANPAKGIAADSDHLGSATSPSYSKGGIILKSRNSVKLPGIRLAYDSATQSYVTFNHAFSYFSAWNNFVYFNRGLKHGEIFSLGEYSFPESAQGDVQNLSGSGGRYLYKPFNGSISISSIIGNSMFTSSPDFYIGYKPEVYFSTLPPRMNTQLGAMDTNDLVITSVGVNLTDTHQIKVMRNNQREYKENLINDEFSYDSASVDAVRRSGIYELGLIPEEKDNFGKIRFEPEVGYPFRIKSIAIRGERQTRR